MKGIGEFEELRESGNLGIWELRQLLGDEVVAR